MPKEGEAFMTADEIAAKAREEGASAELHAVLRWLINEADLAYSRKHWAASSTLRAAITRLSNGLHRTGKD